MAPTPATIKEESEQTQHLPPAGSVDNPMEIDDSDDDEAVVRGLSVTPKRRMKGVCVVENPLAFVKLLVLVPPPGGESPGKRPRPMSDSSSGSNGFTLAATSAVSNKAEESSKQSV